MHNSSLCRKRPHDSSLANVEGQDQSYVATRVGASTNEYCHVVESKSENEVDGYKWRKYGRKPIKGNEHRRHYYRCTAAGCPAIKNVQKSSCDSTKFIITYKRQHDHSGSGIPQKLEDKYEDIVWDNVNIFRAIIIPNQDLKIDLNIPNQDLEIDLNDEELQNEHPGTPSDA
ncbi:WRKY family transcription factor family protein [Trifolium repens]|nr:WRKY family transcription factor family protein [Trifolium repens]